MSDFPAIVDRPPSMTLSTMGEESPGFDLLASVNVGAANAAWPAANLGIYVPVLLQVPATVYKFSFIVGAQAGNYDIGMYDATGVRRVSLGSTLVPAAGIAVADVADTALNPGLYFIAMVVSTVTTATFQRTAPGSQHARLLGVMDQAIGSSTLPDPWTAVGTTNTYLPHITAHLRAMM